jgi:hypothetical protein
MKTGFGWIEVGGARYDHDIVLHTDLSVTKRKKKLSKGQKGDYGHTPLSEAELTFLDEERPEIVYVGTGQYGDLPLTPEASGFLQRYDAVVLPTPEILPLIGRERKKYAALIHVTC